MQNGIRVITAMNRKGGCGKTTLIMGLASAAAERGESV
ncbi:AAA family ATPase, partial [Paracoccus litorisediminis]|nr:AAA family ATPase [Paracoccus litorisediminis]